MEPAVDVAPRPRGRPRSFDREAALARAVRVFWARGYEGTSIADLLRAMQITPPSLYAAFGSKEQLFQEAVAHYARVEASGTSLGLARAKTARAGVEAMLRANADAYATPGKPSGCMVVLGATLGAPANEAVREFLARLRGQAQDDVQHRLEAAVADGELPPGTDTAGMALFYATVLQGLSLQARDGVGRAGLQRIVDGAMAAWDVYTGRARAVGTPPCAETAEGSRPRGVDPTIL